jgi:pimeloyl-ACP methyl ester carboxylesterase
LFLFGDGKDAPPDPFDRRFREACDLYNYGLGLGLAEPRTTNGVVQLQNARRRLPVGEIEIQVDRTHFSTEEFEQILRADQFRVRGLSVRNRRPGVGAPLICVGRFNPQFGLHFSTPATALVRGPGSLATLKSGTSVCALELYPSLGEGTVAIGTTQVPLEIDLTTYRAYNLTQSHVWKLGKLQFLAPAERFPSQLLLNQPFDPQRIPIVFVHGTFSSPVTWAEVANTLVADPVIRKRYQIWSFVYGSGNPLVRSMADLRSALTEQVKRLDPEGTNQALRQMVVIGHSQGGLLTKSTAVDTGDKLWRMVSTNRFEDVKLSEADRADLRRLLFYEPLPFVKRVVFISTPHRGSYLSGSVARRLAQRLVSLPSDLVSRREQLLKHSEGSETSKFLGKRMPTSLDGMSPKNPALLAMADIPVAPGIHAHSIIPVTGTGDYHKGRDGLVTYQSAHVDYVDSEFIVRFSHSCQNEPACVEEIRRILYFNLD